MKKLGTACALVALVAAGCGKDDSSDEETAQDTAAQESGEEGEAAGDAPEVDPEKLADEIGVEPGGMAPEEGVGAEAVAATEGEVELYAGDQIRTAAGATAVVTYADQSVVELAEESVLAIGDRNAGADPASSAAVLFGVARFTVSARGEGEGPFMVYSPGGVIATKGTTFGVGVSVTGAARVGVEEGEVEVVGHSDLETPVSVTAAKAVEVAAEGSVEAPVEFTTDDWGTWRDQAEADVEPAVVVRDHRNRLEVITPEIDATYDVLADLEGEIAAAQDEAAEYESAGNTAGYEATVPEWSASVEASFLASLRLQHLTYAALSHAYLAGEVYTRHPKKVEVEFAPVRPRVAAAILLHKKYHGAVHHHVRPLRGFYYRHHPRGRRVAAKVNVEVPAFYEGDLPEVEPKRIRSRAKVRVYRPPVITRVNAKKRVFVRAPKVGWHGEVKVKPRDHRAKAGWYVRPKKPKARIVTGVKVKAKLGRVFEPRERVTRGKVDIRLGGLGKAGVRVKSRRNKAKGKVGVKGAVKVAPQGGVKVDVRKETRVKSKRAGKTVEKKVRKTKKVRVTPKGGVKAGVKVKGKAKGKGGVVKGKAGVKVKAGGGISIGAKRNKKAKKKKGKKVESKRNKK